MNGGDTDSESALKEVQIKGIIQQHIDECANL